MLKREGTKFLTGCFVSSRRHLENFFLVCIRSAGNRELLPLDGSMPLLPQYPSKENLVEKLTATDLYPLPPILAKFTSESLKPVWNMFVKKTILYLCVRLALEGDGGSQITLYILPLESEGPTESAEHCILAFLTFTVRTTLYGIHGF
jgi:hypothetical protein